VLEKGMSVKGYDQWVDQEQWLHADDVLMINSITKYVRVTVAVPSTLFRLVGRVPWAHLGDCRKAGSCYWARNPETGELYRYMVTDSVNMTKMPVPNLAKATYEYNLLERYVGVLPSHDSGKRYSLQKCRRRTQSRRTWWR